MKKKTLKIGEMSNLFGISKQTLQYYDSIDIFKPGFIDENGYRMYYFEQCLQLASVLYFRNKGLALDQIRELKQSLNPETYLNNMKEQYESLDQEIYYLKELQKTIRRKIDFVTDNMNVNDVGKIWIEEKPQRFYYSIGEEAILYIHDGFYQNPTVVFYEGKERDFGCYLYGEHQRPQSWFKKEELKIIPSGKYLCGYHMGEYEKILERVYEIRESRPDLQLAHNSIHFNIIDQFVESDSSGFLTEINIKLL